MNMLAAIGSTGYNVLLVLHLLAMAVWFGANVAIGVTHGRAVGASNEIIGWLAGVQRMVSMRIKSAAFLVLFVTGMGLVGMSEKIFKMSDPFVSVGFFAIILGGALGGMVYAPGSRAVEAAAKDGDAAAIKRHNDKMGLVGMVESLVVVITVLFMVFKWG